MRRTAVFVALACAAACGKKDSDTAAAAPTTAAKTAEPAPVKAPSRGPEHPVYSLTDNRLSAHLVRRGGTFIPAGSAGFAKYSRFGNTRRTKNRAWELRRVKENVRVARLAGGSGKLDLPLTARDLTTPVVRLRAFSETARAASVRVNGNPDLNAQLAAGWNTLEIPVPAGQLREGENELLFFVRGTGLDVAWIQVGGAAASDADLAFYDPADKSLVLPKDGGMAWYVTIPESGRITGDVPDSKCRIDVRASGDDGKLVEGQLVGIGSAVDLSQLGGRAARLELLAGGCDRAKLVGATLVIPGATPTALKAAPPRYVLMIIMDSLRADRVRPWDKSARPETPVFDKLAETSAVFLQNYVQGNESRVSHASIWTSLYPIKHAMIGATDKLDGKWKTIDELAKASGMHVVGVSANGYVDPKRWGFGSGWNTYSNHIHDQLGLKGEDVVEHGLRLVDKKTEPWFLYLGLIDTHVSWRAKEPWISKYDPDYQGARFKEVFSGEDAARAAAGAKLTADEIEHVRAIYDSNVSYQDKLLGDVIKKLEEWGIWEQTMLIVTADHGDEQWEDGRVGHGASMRDMLVHVPLLVRYPPLVPAGKFTEGTEVIDIVPTLAEALGAAMDAEWQGESLLSLAQGVTRGYPRLSMTSMYEDAHAARLGPWKARVPGGGTPRIYNLREDPDEMKDVAGTPAAAIGGRMVLDALWMLRSLNPEWKKMQWGNPANVSLRFAVDLGE